MISLENDIVIAKIDPHGAELKSLFHRGTDIEYMWQGNPVHWNRSSPILFPIVGSLKEGYYTYAGQNFALPRHGFARDQRFEVLAKSSRHVEFKLGYNEETLSVFPFKFSLHVLYELDGDTVTINYRICNEDTEEAIFFSIGGHPAFNVPLTGSSGYNDYYIEFEPRSRPERHMLTKDGLLEPSTSGVPWTGEGRLYLSNDLFYKDALVFKDIKCDAVVLRSVKDNRGVKLTMKDFNHFGLWAAPDAPFVCLEPWNGISDFVDHNNAISEKLGINSLEPDKMVSYAFAIKIF